MELKSNKNIAIQRIDLELYHLFCALQDLLSNNFDTEIEQKINDLMKIVEQRLFGTIAKGHDIEWYEGYFIAHLEQ